MRDDRRRELTPRELYRQRRREQIQRRRLVALLIVLGIIILIIVLAATTCRGGDTGAGSTTTSGETTSTTLGTAEFTADLMSDDIDATGTFTMAYDPDLDELTYELMLDDVDSPTVANIYEAGEDGSEGTVVYVIYADDAEQGPFTGRLTEGVIEEASLTGSLEGGTIGDLMQLIRDGNAYVSVGTADTPVDAITGELVETTPDTGSTDSTDESDTTDETSGDETTDTTAE